MESNSKDFLLISVAGKVADGTGVEQFSRVISSDIATITAFDLPEFKVGSLDSLVGLSDELVKLDPWADSICLKMTQFLKDLLRDYPEKLSECFKIDGKDIEDYLRSFTWDTRVYTTKRGTREIVDEITLRVKQIDSELKQRQSGYISVKNQMNSATKNNTGSLVTRSLVDIVKPEHVVQNSECLVTTFVVITQHQKESWLQSYETLVPMVVPRSSQLIYDAGDNQLWSVTLFRRVLADFQRAARASRFVVRDFEYNAENVEENENHINQLDNELKGQWGECVVWAKTIFGECFSLCLHVKSIRLFVESVLRYGLPVNFKAILFHIKNKKKKVLEKQLNSYYMSFTVGRGEQRFYDVHASDEIKEGSGESSGANDRDAIMLNNLQGGDYFSYVCLAFGVNYAKYT